jgi:hypothetical protein
VLSIDAEQSLPESLTCGFQTEALDLPPAKLKPCLDISLLQIEVASCLRSDEVFEQLPSSMFRGHDLHVNGFVFCFEQRRDMVLGRDVRYEGEQSIEKISLNCSKSGVGDGLVDRRKGCAVIAVGEFGRVADEFDQPVG